MCGLCGYTGPPRPGLIEAMIDAIRPRGPDGEGMDSAHGVHLGHTRLAIIDPAHGGQPLKAGAYTVVYNGEIYNYAALRAELEAMGQVFTTHCDTELIPIGFSVWGEDLFRRLDGMFAIALRDDRDGRLWLARDHLGIKPLYFAHLGGQLAFASTARALAAHPNLGRRLRPDAVREFLMYRWVRSGRHLLDGVEILKPGCLLAWHDAQLSIRPFWSARRRNDNGVETSTVDWRDRIGGILEDSVKRQLRSDVPVGVLLSGGVDSSLVAHYAARHAETPLTAFTFATGDAVDETASAAATARHLGMKHRVVRLEASDFSAFPQVVADMDNPVGDAVILPTWKLCRETARDVKVVLTGEGADELFAGYAHLKILRRLDALRPWAPLAVPLAPLLRLVPVAILDRLFDYQASLGQMGRSAAVELLAALGDSGQLARRASATMGDADLMQATHLGPPPPPETADLSLAGLLHDLILGWLPEEILHKMDQLSMAHGLEARVPFVSPALYDALLECPERLLWGSGGVKILLREIAAAEGLPAAFRRKVAFHLPVETLWRDQLLALCRERLTSERLRAAGIVRENFVASRLALLERGEFLAAKQLVTILALHEWCEARGASL